MDIAKEFADIEATQQPRGALVRSVDGDFFFLSESDTERLRISREHYHTLEKVWKGSGGGSAEPLISCGALWNWLTHHEPNSVAWRRVSVMWMNQC